MIELKRKKQGRILLVACLLIAYGLLGLGLLFFNILNTSTNQTAIVIQLFFNPVAFIVSSGTIAAMWSVAMFSIGFAIAALSWSF
jgi:hypothetical protein